MPRNDSNLDALDNTIEKLNANFQVKLHKCNFISKFPRKFISKFKAKYNTTIPE